MKNRNRSRGSVDVELKKFEEKRKGDSDSELPDKIKFTEQDLVPINPKTKNQKAFFDAYYTTHEYPSEENEDRVIIDKNFMLIGSPGTGKTLIALHKALEEVITEKTKEKILIIRSVVETRQRGFLPGDKGEKEKPFELPYVGICDELIKYKWKNYERLKKSGIIEFESTSNLRGITLHDTVIIVDECQNLNFHELDTVITRTGKNSRIVFCGDFAQTDLLYNKNDTSGMPQFLEIINGMKSFQTIQFTGDDIVRSGLVKEYILKKNKIEIKNKS